MHLQSALAAAARLWRCSQQHAAAWQLIKQVQQAQAQVQHQPQQQLHQQQYQPFHSSRGAAVSGISMPSPNRLDQLMKLESLLDKSPNEIENIWMQYHAEDSPGSRDRVASVQSAQEFATFRSRARASPMFVLPLKKAGDAYLTMLLQCQLPFVLLTTLEQYRTMGSAAPPALTLVHYAELEQAKGLVLVRGDIINRDLVSVPEARALMELVRAFYTDSDGYKLVHSFNHDPAAFDFNDLLMQLSLPAKNRRSKATEDHSSAAAV